MRITKAFTEALVLDMLTHAFKDRCIAQLQASAEFAEVIWRQAISEEQEAAMKKLPAEWFEKNAGMNYTIDGQWHSASFGGDLECEARSVLFNDKEGAKLLRENSQSRIMPKIFTRYNGHGASFSSASRIGEKINKFLKKEQELEDAIETTRLELRGIISSVTTYKKLVEVWPEVEPFAKKYFRERLPGGVTGLPAIPVKDLNKRLGLPV